MPFEKLLHKMGLCGSKTGNPKNATFHLQTCHDHVGGINCMGLSEDGSVLATGSEDSTVRLWSTKTEECECIGILKGHEEYITYVLIEENFVVTASADKTIRKWDISTCECVAKFIGHLSLVNRVICTGDFIFSSSYDRTARCWDFDSEECIRVFSGHKRGVYPLVFIPADGEDITPESFDWEGNKDLLITGSADFTARSWSFETGKTLRVFRGHKGAITTMGTDPTGKTLYTGSADFTVMSWNIMKGEKLKVFDGHGSAVICMQVVNKIIYTGSSDHTARSWVAEFGDCTRTYKSHRHSVACLKYYNGLVITGSGDCLVRAFDAKSGSVQRTFKGHDSGVNCLQVVDGKLFTGSHDGTLRVWDITGLKDDVTFGQDEKKSTDKKVAQKKEIEKLSGNDEVLKQKTKIMIEDEYMGNGKQHTNGSIENGVLNSYNGNGVSNGTKTPQDVV